MITAICSFKLRPGLTRERAVQEMRHSLPLYRGRQGLIRKYICIDLEELSGCGVYLWADRPAADAYFAEVIPAMRQQLGSEPTVRFFDTPMVVDNASGELQVVD